MSQAEDGPTYDQLLVSLRRAYDGGAAAREATEKAAWKVAERAAFLARLRAEGARRLLEVGAGTGQDALFFQQAGLHVTATDLSPEMVAHCRAKGLDAHVRDFLHLGFPPGSFDALYALNCLLHVPDSALDAVLAALRTVLRPGGLFYLGLYGGTPHAGPAPDDPHDPPRFFAWRSDEAMQAAVARHFEVESFHVLHEHSDHRFQSFTLRKKGQHP